MLRRKISTYYYINYNFESVTPYVSIPFAPNEGFSPFVTPYVLYYSVTPYVASHSCMVADMVAAERLAEKSFLMSQRETKKDGNCWIWAIIDHICNKVRYLIGSNL